MALDTRHHEAIFVEIYEKETPGPNGVSRREDVTTLTEARRAELAKHFASRIEREFYGVRIARVVTETLQEF